MLLDGSRFYRVVIWFRKKNKQKNKNIPIIRRHDIEIQTASNSN